MNLSSSLSSSLSDFLSSAIDGGFYLNGGADILDSFPWVLRLEADTDVYGAANAPALDWNPASGDWESVFGPTPTFSRNSVATYRDENGIIQTAAIDEKRIDYGIQGDELTPARTQLVRSTDFSLYWSTAGDISLSDGAGYGGQPSKVMAMSDGSARYVGGTFDAPPSDVFAISVWVRSISGNQNVKIYHFNSATGTSQSKSITSEWTHVFVTCEGNGTSIELGFGCNTEATLEISQPQAELGTEATAFIENTTGSPVTIPATYGPNIGGALIEPSATNLFPNSDCVTPSDWAGFGGVASAGAGLNGMPSVLLSAADPANASVEFYQNMDVTIETYRLSIMVKRVSGDGDIKPYCRAGTAGTSVDTPIGEWVKVEFTSIQTAARAERIGVGFYDATTPTTFEVIMPQFELGEVTTSWISTSGSPVTREADIVTIAGTDFSDMWNADKGMIYAEVFGRLRSANTYVFSISSSSTEKIESTYNINRQLRIFSGIEQSTQEVFPEPVIGEVTRLAGSWEVGLADLAVGGAGATEGNPAVIPLCDNIIICGTTTDDRQLNGHIRRLIYWPATADELGADLSVITDPATSEQALAHIGENANFGDHIPSWGNQAYVGENYLSLPGVAGNYASLDPIPGILSGAFNIKMLFFITPTGSNAVLLSFGNSYIRIGSSRRLQCVFGGFSSGVDYWSPADYTIPDEGTECDLEINWDGSTISGIFNGVALTPSGLSGPVFTDTDFEIGARGSSTDPLAGKFHSVNISESEDVDLDFSTFTRNATTGRALTGQTVTIEQSGTPAAQITASQSVSDAVQDVLVNQPIYLPKDDDGSYLYLPGLSANAAYVDMGGDLGLEGDFILETTFNSLSRTSQYLCGIDSNDVTTFMMQVVVAGGLPDRVIVRRSGSGDVTWDGFSPHWTEVDGLRAHINWGSECHLYGLIGGAWTLLQTVVDASPGPSTPSTYNIAIGRGSTAYAEMNYRSFKIWDNAAIEEPPDIDVDFTSATHAATSFECTTGQTVTVNQSGLNPAKIIGKSVLRFDGIDDYLVTTFESAQSEWHAFLVFQQNSAVDLAEFFSTENDLTTNPLIQAFATFFKIGGPSYANPYSDNTARVLMEVKWNANNQSRLTINGTNHYNVGNTTFSQLQAFIGGSGAAHAAADYEAVFIADETLTDEEAIEINAAINSKYKVYDA